MKLRLPSLPNPPPLRQAFAVGRDLLGAAALAATVAMLVFVIWISIQFQKAPGIDQLANAGSGLMWMIAGVYAALWLVRTLHPAMSGKRPAAEKRRFNVAPLVRASGNGAIATLVLFILGLAGLMPVPQSWLIVWGYPIATLAWLTLFAIDARRLD